MPLSSRCCRRGGDLAGTTRLSPEQVVRIQLLKSGDDKETVLADEFAIEPDLASAVIFALDIDHIPVDSALVAIARNVVRLAWCKMKRPCNLLVQEAITHRLQDVWIEGE